MMEAFILPFLTTMLAELGDKTQLMVVCLSSKTRRRFQLLIGAVLAFLVADGLAVLLGAAARDIIPESYIKLVAGLVFIIFGVLLLLKRNKEEAESCDIGHPLWSGFGLILAAEMGDKSQIMAALFAAEYNPFLVLAGVLLAMIILTAAAIMVGKLLSAKLDRKKVSFLAGLVFVAIGVYTIAGMLISNLR